jgi:xylulokinase
MDYVLGLDIGTSSIKAITLDEHGTTITEARVPTPTVVESGERAVHYAEHLWQAVVRLICQITAKHADASIVGIAVASIGEEGFPIDGHGFAVYPGILWHDPRTRTLVPWWVREVGAERIYHITGLPTDYTYSALKLQWLYQNVPNIMKAAVSWLGVSEYIAFRLTGAQATCPSLASRTMLYDLIGNKWSDELLDASQISRSLLPPIVNSGTVLGTVTHEAAAVTGLPVSMPVAVGGHDHICGLLAAGGTAPGNVVHSSGTAEVLMKTMSLTSLEDVLAAGSGLILGAHVVPGEYYQLGGRHSGAILQWWEQALAPGDSRDALWLEAASAPVGSRGLIFVPYMFGKGSPDRDREVTGSILGLTSAHTRGDIMRSVLEGLCFDTIRLNDAQGRVDETVAIDLIGGLARQPLWTRLKADILSARVRVGTELEATAQGAAFLAGLGSGIYSGFKVASTTLRHHVDVVVPNPETAELYRTLYAARYAPAERMVLSRWST